MDSRFGRCSTGSSTFTDVTCTKNMYNVKRIEARSTQFADLMRRQGEKCGYTDICLVLGDSTSIKLHSIVLYGCSRSTDLLAKIEEARHVMELPVKVPVPDGITLETVNQILRFLYLGEVLCAKRCGPTFESAAQWFGIPTSGINGIEKPYYQYFIKNQVDEHERSYICYSKNGKESKMDWEGKEHIDAGTDMPSFSLKGRYRLYCPEADCGRAFTSIDDFDAHILPKSCPPNVTFENLDGVPLESTFACKNCKIPFVELDYISEPPATPMAGSSTGSHKIRFGLSAISPASTPSTIKITFCDESMNKFCPDCKVPEDDSISHSTPAPRRIDYCKACETEFSTATSANEDLLKHFAAEHKFKLNEHFSFLPEPKCLMETKEDSRVHPTDSMGNFLNSVYECCYIVPQQIQTEKDRRRKYPAPLQTALTCTAPEQNLGNLSTLAWWKRPVCLASHSLKRARAPSSTRELQPKRSNVDVQPGAAGSDSDDNNQNPRKRKARPRASKM